jgi:hypothetical protein
MKYSLELSSYRHANVWLDEAPPAAYTASSVVTKVVMPKVAIDAARRIAGVEIETPPGPSSYALLGAELVEADVDGLEVIVLVNEVGVRFPESLAMSDEVKIGLRNEYVGAVFRGVAGVAEAVGAPTKRRLRFRWAAHGLVGSSQRTFEKASGVVLQLLMLSSSLEDLEDRIRTLVGQLQKLDRDPCTPLRTAPPGQPPHGLPRLRRRVSLLSAAVSPLT